jgi:hypothetical protein
VSWWATLWTRVRDNAGAAAFSAVVGIASFVGGQFNEQSKQLGADERLAAQGRRQLFESTAQEMGAYVTHWKRLAIVSNAQELLHDKLASQRLAAFALESARAKGARPKEEEHRKVWHVERLQSDVKLVEARKERYVQGRDVAKDKLMGNFEQARLFFGSETGAAIDALEAFEREHPDFRPDSETWRRMVTGVLRKMGEEIKSDERKLRPNFFGLWRDGGIERPRADGQLL